MHLAILTLRFRLPGNRSLKDKRRRLNGLRDRFGKLPGIAVCESGLQDSTQEAEWSFVAVGTTRAIVDQSLDKIEDWIVESVDAVILHQNRELL